MAVPKKKVSKAKRGMRRAHKNIRKVHISFDSVTGEPKLPHHLSLEDGYYNGKKVIKIKDKKQGEKSDQKRVSRKVENKN